MRSTVSLLPCVAAEAQLLWPQVSFHLRGVHPTASIRWEDGPTRAEVQEAITQAFSHDPDKPEVDWEKVHIRRSVSMVAWALVRGPQMDPTSSHPPTSREELYCLPEVRGRSPLELYAPVDTTNFENLHQLAGSSVQLARAETAASLAQGITLEGNLHQFDIWLRYGGWQLACVLNP